MNRREVLAGGLSVLSAPMLAPRSLAYPDRAIRLVVPFSPGGATDVVGRLWAEKMKPVLGTVVTENRGGGGGVTGAAEVARAQPDGHTFLFGNTSTQVLIPAISGNPPYDPLKDFVGVYILCNSPASIVVHESLLVRNLAELIAYATRKVAADADFQKTLIASGFEPILDSGPDATRAFIVAETARLVPIMK